MPFNQKTIGAGLVGFSLILLFILTFIKLDVDKQGAFLCETISSNPELTMEECPVHKTNISWFIVASFGLAFLILGISLYMIFIPIKKEEQIKNEEKEQKVKPIDISKMDEDEKMVYDLLLQHEGSMYQSDIIKETGFSKVKMTRILDKMASRKVIERKRRGMTNIVILV